jgi:hypothetical protein
LLILSQNLLMARSEYSTAVNWYAIAAVIQKLC